MYFLPQAFQDQLAQHGFPLAATQLEALQHYTRLIQAYNAAVGVVATHEVQHLVLRHIVDSLSLAPPMAQCAPEGKTHLDIGSGGGLPAIPLSVAFPNRAFVLVERSRKKIGFLRKVLATLGCNNVSLIHGAFPAEKPTMPIESLTARAVEKPAQVHGAIAAYMQSGAAPTDNSRNSLIFFVQTTPDAAFQAPMFHVEQYADVFAEEGWRRGVLYTVRCH